MIDIEELKKLAEAAGGDEWTSDAPHEVTLDRFHVWHADGDAVCACYDNIGHMPDPVGQQDVAAFIAAANPQTVLALIEYIESQKELIHALGTYAQDVPDDRDNAGNLNRDKMIEDAQEMLGKTLYLNYRGDKYEY